MKKVLIKSAMAFMAIVLITMYGCGEKDKSEVPVKIEEIEWNVEEREFDGEKEVVFVFTNNSDYPISRLSLTFRQKDAAAEESDKKYIFALVSKRVNPGESVLFEGVEYRPYRREVKSAKEFEGMQPYVLRIDYVDKNTIYTAEYDYAAKKFTEQAGSGIPVYSWPDNEYTRLLPKPEFDQLIIDEILPIDEEVGFGFKSNSVTENECIKYIESCKEKGFTVGARYENGYYTAENEQGYGLSIVYGEYWISANVYR